MDNSQINSLQGEIAVAQNVIDKDTNEILQLQNEVQISTQFLNMIANQTN